MPTPSPLPVVVVDGPGTDWWATVLDGALAAGLSAIVAALVAWLLIGRQRRADLQTARELAALDAAREIGKAIWAAIEALNAQISKSSPRSIRIRRAAVNTWFNAAREHYPALYGYIHEDELKRFSDALRRHVELLQEWIPEHPDADVDELVAVEWPSWDDMSNVGMSVALVLENFRRHGPSRKASRWRRFRTWIGR